MADPRLGRRPAPDQRDTNFLMRSALRIFPPVPERRWKYHGSGWWGDQGSTPQCVAYSWTHFLEDGPWTQPGPAPCIVPASLYHDAQKVDEWPGENYDGTSVRAGAKVLAAAGYIESYWWAWDTQTVIDAILRFGPVVVGTNWYSGMFTPDAEGFLHVTGSVAGGHAYLLNGVNEKRGVIRVKNSWGRDWGRHGHAYIGVEDLGRLLGEQGEACIAMEKSPG